MKAGSSLNINHTESIGVGILQKGVTIVLNSDHLDTMYCNDLEFDYSLVNTQSVKEPRLSTIVTHVANDALEVSGLPAASSLAIFDLLGAQVLSKIQSLSRSATISITSLRSGVYYLRISSEGVVQTSKFVVRR
jgi:hypothetical protein